jgi:formylmethanofuran dehydrogenase subunit A
LSHVTTDTGQVVFGETTTMTADGPFEYTLHQISHSKWINGDVETETNSGIVPFKYKRSSSVHATQWSIALELALLITDPWKVFMSTDHPNASPFTNYPKIVTWLMSRKAREELFEKINQTAQHKSLLPTLDREYTFSDLAIATRAGPAKSLGLEQKGHLGLGADADIAIYDVNPENIDPAKKHKQIRKAFSSAAYTIKDGQIVYADREIVQSINGKTFWVKPEISSSLKEVVPRIKDAFEDYYTVQYENYIVPEHHLAISSPMTVKAEV